MSKIKAIPCEVWSRVVGYYRPVQDFAPHKKEEYRDRFQHEPDGIAKHFEEPKPVVRHG